MLRGYDINNIVGICLVFLNKKFRNRGFLSCDYASMLHIFFKSIFQHIKYIYINLNDGGINITANINRNNICTRHILYL